MGSASYKLFRQAIAKKMQVVCIYHGKRREVCPVILGHTKGVEKTLVYQFGGETDGKLPNWRCLTLSEVSEIVLREGRWHGGKSHQTSQTCVADVEFDVNPNSPYIKRPTRRLAAR